jgi:uridine kinase
MDVRVKKNYDHPDSLETDLLITHIHQLLEGKSVVMPDYYFSIHTRKKETTTEPCSAHPD